jgi:hypothetical protein
MVHVHSPMEARVISFHCLFAVALSRYFAPRLRQAVTNASAIQVPELADYGT